jgi:hypothetical protein
MKKSYLLFGFLAVIFNSCCDDPVEVNRYNFNNQELEILPYSLNQVVPFEHSNGYKFDLKVTKNSLEWKEDHPFCEYGCCDAGYFSYQNKTVVLSSSYPALNIEFQMNANDEPADQFQSNSLYIKINWNQNAQILYDSLFEIQASQGKIFYDSLLINQKMYYKVIESDLITNYSTDSTVIEPKSILYNKAFGLLQIKISNNETYSIQ